MRVLHVTPYFAPDFQYGGPPRSVLGLCRALRRVGVDAHVLTTSAGATLSKSSDDEDASLDVPVRYLPRTFPKRYFRAAALRRVVEVEAVTYDLVHMHGCWNFAVWEAAAVCRRAGIPYVVTPRGMLAPWSFRRSSLMKQVAYRGIERRTLAAAAWLHATSDAECGELGRLGLPAPIVIVPNGIDPPEPVSAEQVAAFRRRHGIAPNELLVLYLGRLHPKKGVEILAEAFRRLPLSSPRVRLIVAGSGDRGYIATLTRACRDLLVSEAMLLIGHVDGAERAAAFASADIFALISHSENFGLAVGEAMTAGLPVVVSRQCPWPHIESWQSGYWVEPDARTVASALEQLCRNDERRRWMGANGRDGVRAAFGWDAIGARMALCYEETLSARAAGASNVAWRASA